MTCMYICTMMQERSKTPPQGTIPVYPGQPGYIHIPYGIWLCQPKAVLVKAVTASRHSWLACTGYHGNGAFVIVVNRI